MNLTEFQIKLVHVNWIVQMGVLIAETLYVSVTETWMNKTKKIFNLV